MHDGTNSSAEKATQKVSSFSISSILSRSEKESEKREAGREGGPRNESWRERRGASPGPPPGHGTGDGRGSSWDGETAALFGFPVAGHPGLPPRHPLVAAVFGAFPG